MGFAPWYQSLFGVCMIVLTHANTFFYLHVISICLHKLAWDSNGSIKYQAFEWCFLSSKYHDNFNAMSSFTVLRPVPWNKQSSFMFSLWLCFFFIVYYLLVMQQIMNTVRLLKFQLSGQFSVFKRSKIITIKKNMLPSRIEMCGWDLKFQLHILQEII